jgi:hypothetical protein
MRYAPGRPPWVPGRPRQHSVLSLVLETAADPTARLWPCRGQLGDARTEAFSTPKTYTGNVCALSAGPDCADCRTTAGSPRSTVM